jgi:endonuclease YncB( thermonuclease family)
MLTRLLLTCFALLLFPSVSYADFSGPVVSVLDGDTIEVLVNGIDCPESM